MGVGAWVGGGEWVVHFYTCSRRVSSISPDFHHMLTSLFSTCSAHFTCANITVLDMLSSLHLCFITVLDMLSSLHLCLHGSLSPFRKL
jgi:hypothetical protein